MYFEEVIYKNGGETSINSPHFYKDGLFVQYYYERKAWKEKVNLVERYYYQQKLSDYSEEEKSPEWYSDYEYAVQLHFCEEDLSEMTHYLTSRNYDRENKKIIPLSQKMLDKIAIQYPELNRAWLLLEEGTMTTSGTDNSTLQNGCITIPAEAWTVIKQQAASLESRDSQINELIEMLKQQLSVHTPSQRLVCG